jgi:hypothetical protein
MARAYQRIEDVCLNLGVACLVLVVIVGLAGLFL